MASMLIKALSKIAVSEVPKGPVLKSSGNIKSRIQDYSEDRLRELADAYFPKSGSQKDDIFRLGVDMGRVAKQKVGYLIELPQGWVSFIGSEAEILARIEEYESKLTTEDKGGAV